MDDAANLIEELRRERDAARAEANQLRPIAIAALHLSAEAEAVNLRHGDGDLSWCADELEALWAACDKYEAEP